MTGYHGRSNRFGNGMSLAAIVSLLAAGTTGAVDMLSSEEREDAPTPDIRPSPAPNPRPHPPTARADRTGPRPPLPRRYTVKPGDSLSAIAEAQLGHADKWMGLYGANIKRIGPDPDSLRAGDTLELRVGKVPRIPVKVVKSTPRIAPAVGNGKHAKRYSKRAESAKYANNLDGWIREALSVMRKHGIPGSYDGIRRNIMRESGGNPRAINRWDSNARRGTPSKGLLQTIGPTFNAYHVAGTSWDIYDPVANIAAACNYAAQRYGSIDNVNGAY